MKDKQLRRMIADVLKYLKKKDGYWVPREDIEVSIQTYLTYGSYCDVSISDIVDRIDPKDYASTYMRGKTYQDNGGYEEGSIELYYYRKQTDQEYFDSICQYILPTEYQKEQYQQYLRFKKMFESGGQ